MDCGEVLLVTNSTWLLGDMSVHKSIVSLYHCHESKFTSARQYTVRTFHHAGEKFERVRIVIHMVDTENISKIWKITSATQVMHIRWLTARSKTLTHKKKTLKRK